MNKQGLLSLAQLILPSEILSNFEVVRVENTATLIRIYLDESANPEYSENPDFESKCGVFQFPGIEGANDPNRMIVKTDNLLMSATTEHQDAVIALMKMFTDETAQKYTAEVGGKIPIIKDIDIDYDAAPAQLKYITDILANATGTFGFYNESLASVEAGDCFDNAMVDIFLGNQTPEEAFQTVQTFYEDNVWE